MQFRSSIVLTGLGLGALLSVSSLAVAQAPSLGSAQDFAVLGASTVTSSGATVVTGDLGVAPGTAITGFPPGIVNGTIHAGDALALQAQGDLTTAYNALAGAICTTSLTGMDLGGLTLTPGVYCFAASAPLNGVLTLDALGDPSAVFIFQIGSTLLTAIDSSVDLINGAKAGNVYWQVGSSATVGAGTALKGNVVALASITLSAGSTVSGRALARTGAVTLDVGSVTLPTAVGCTTTASVVDLSLGCGPQIPLLVCAPPMLGQSTKITLSGSQAQKTAFIVATPFGAPSSDFGGCPMFVGPSSRFLSSFLTNVNGNDSYVHLPTSPALCGTQWTLQGLVFSSRNVVSVSNTLLCTMGT